MSERESDSEREEGREEGREAGRERKDFVRIEGGWGGGEVTEGIERNKKVKRR